MRLAGINPALCACVLMVGCSADDGASQARRAPAPTASDADAQTAAAEGENAAASDMTGQPRPPEDSNAGAGAAGSSGASPSPAAGGGDFRATVPAADATVVFDWDETVPGQGDCQAGSYAGTFTCEYVPAGGDPNLPLAIVTGPVTMTLEESESGEFLEIADGELVGIAQLVIGFQAKLSGRLDCATNEFEATAVDGVYGFGDPSALPLGNFEGGLGGSLDRQTVTLSGEWSLSEAMGGTCAGPWEARFTP